MKRHWPIWIATVAIAGFVSPASNGDVGEPGLPPIPVVGQLLFPDSPSRSQTQASQAAPTRPSVASVPNFARSITGEINRTRRTYGLRPLRESAALATGAVAHATALATSGEFAHSWPDGRPYPTWIRTFYPDRGYRIWAVGENLLWSTPGLDAHTVVARWLASPTHRHILLTPSWREVGIGVVSATAAPGAYGGNDVDVVAAEFGLRGT